MATVKTATYDPELLTLAAAARALAHPGRLHLLRTLAERRSCVCGDLVDALPLAQSTVSQHLRELKEAGFVRGEIDGPRTCYCLDPAALARAGAGFAQLFARLAGATQGEDGDDEGC